MTFAPQQEHWVELARSADILSIAQRLGAHLKRMGHEWIGPCPHCGGTDRFGVNPTKGLWNCGHMGGAGGDVIEMVRHCLDCNFEAAVAYLAGPKPEAEAPPKRNGHDHEAEADARQGRWRDSFAGLWADALPIAGSQAEAYLKGRGLTLQPHQCEDLRFVAHLPYWGYPSDDPLAQSVLLGAYPAMLAAIRDVDSNLIGVHRTYLEPQRPAKLQPPGDRERNSPKKVMGKARGMIRLSPLWPVMAIGEGIETTLAWYALGLGPEEIGIAAGVSLGNLSGSATGSQPHPVIKERMIQNGDPDPDRPGLELAQGVREVILLGDGDSDPETTHMHLLTGARRFRAQGRSVSIHMAPPGWDFGDLWLEVRTEGGLR